MTTPPPTTPDEARQRIARELFDAHQLVALYAGRPSNAGQLGCVGGVGDGILWTVANSRLVRYRLDNGVEGEVKVRALERIALAAATRGAIDRLTAALAEWAAVHADRHAEFGASWWQQPDQVRATPAWRASIRREHAAHDELVAARAAWWDGQPGVQLDLFGAAG